ncbi:hypothetical protein [Streptomyces sp. NBC_00454]|uniref:hypothetical protein n=1 Tax=Streptomyces sp. NBC_00454 TaxID=2975747 RepID=UPI0030E13A75
MYLIHLKLGLAADRFAPPGLGDLIRRAARPGEGLQHVTVHPDVPGGPVLGMFLTADRVEQAEVTAGLLCRRALATSPKLRGVTLLRWKAELVSPPYDGFPERGQLMPVGNPSTGNLFHPF